MRVYDYRTDQRNVFVSPECRSRFLTFQPGDEAALHSHDLGQEVFLVLEGTAEFVISGESADVGPGQLVMARAGEPHRVANHGLEPVVMYLSVAPHVQPTHTGRRPDGSEQPPSFAPNAAYDDDSSDHLDLGELMDRHLAAIDKLEAAALGCARAHRRGIERLQAQRRADIGADQEALRATMWETLRPVFEQIAELGASWNAVAPRIGST